MADVDRPNPLKDVAARIGAIWAGLSAIVGLAVTFGIFTAAQGAAINNLGTAIPNVIVALGVIAGTVIPLVGSLVAAFHVAARGKDKVTPVISPMNNEGELLVPMLPARLAGNVEGTLPE